MSVEVVKRIAAAVCVVLLAACSAPAALTEAQRRQLSSQPVLYAVNYVPSRPFTIRPEDQARARFISRAVPDREPSRSQGAAPAEDATRGSARRARIFSRAPARPAARPDDPAVHIKQSLAAGLSAQLGVARVEPVQLSASEEAVEALRKRFTSGVLLDVRTLRWGLENGHVAYLARVRIIDLDAGKIVWIGACEWKPDGHVDRAIGADDLLADDAHVLRAAIGHAAESCARSLRASLLASAGHGGKHASA